MKRVFLARLAHGGRFPSAALPAAFGQIVEGLGEPVFVRAAQGNGHVGADFGWVVRVTVRRDNERAVGLEPALVNGAVGVVVAPRGRLVMVLCFTIARGKIVAIDAVGDPEPLRQLDLAVLTD